MVVIKARPEHKHEGLVTSLLAPTVDGIYTDNCPMKIKYFNNTNKVVLGPKISLVPTSTPFLPSVCIHNNAREWKTTKNGEGLGAFIT